MDIQENFSLAAKNTFRTGGIARFYLATTDLGELKSALEFARKQNLPVKFLGGGSNVLISDEGYDGLVISFTGREIFFDENSGSSKEEVVVVEAGAVWDKVVAETTKRELQGIECLSFIPGSTGGAVVQNIGAYGQEIKDVILWVEALDTESGEVRRFLARECDFGYRDSFFKSAAGRKYLILKLAMVLKRGAPGQATYKDLIDYYKGNEESIKKVSDIREAVIAIRKAKLPDVAKLGTAGSFFKNPVLNEEEYEKIKSRFPDLPGFKTDKGIKIPLGWIIDKVCGLKGYRQGNVGIYEKQALVLVNFGGATTNEVKALANKIADEVFERTGIRIQREVEYIPEYTAQNSQDVINMPTC